MLLKSNVIVRGARPTKGDYNGRPYDNTKVYIETEIKAGERASGSVTSEYGWGSSDNYDRIEKLEYPFKAEAVMQIVSNGKDTRTILIDLIPEKTAPKA